MVKDMASKMDIRNGNRIPEKTRDPVGKNPVGLMSTGFLKSRDFSRDPILAIPPNPVPDPNPGLMPKFRSLMDMMHFRNYNIV